MDKFLIRGHEKIESDYGYWPTFHDDIVDKIVISGEGIIMFIKMQTSPKGMDIYPQIKLIFSGVKNFKLDGEIYGCASIILSIETQKLDNCIETQITSSLGAGGIISCNEIFIE
ncbi:hypothetical protein CLHUN_16180 [Ruminiclostridium hungatei]|uniref:Uncharacterized protein n=1 Tax=Ruminiclostridium hungatei TaxID=48256 RepID=A0A1V4SLD4_RUMHU|nr:Imm50 family immunity protein [Ruminiclostridium hungatei]OPX44624.1 hypothetical protein CLHUN_16180 [Ruminiclostridium hungatei]